MKKIYLLFPLVVLLLLSACRKDEDTSSFTDNSPPPPIIENYSPEVKPVTSSVVGEVYDISQVPVENATVRLGNATTLTDQYGLFSFENISMNEKGTFITVQQEGFLDGSRRFFPRENTESRIAIEMITENYRPSFEATTGGTVTINGTTGVAFAPNSIVNAGGEVYDGEVYVTYAYLDPTANSTANRMPGNLQGVRTDLEEVALQSFGMINLSLEDADGAPLNIGEGFTATISVALPASIIANAPNEIPLWSFNETFGIWVEEGSATKVNGHYVGEVNHFSWWNCDAPFPLVELDVTLTDENGDPVSSSMVAIGFGSDSLATYYSYTNQDGFTSGKVPAGEELILQIRGICGEVIYSEFIGPFSENTSLSISVNDSGVNNTQITGTLIDCEGNLIIDGGVIVQVGEMQFIQSVDDGTFDFFISTCDGATNLTIKGLDFEFESDPYEGGIIGTPVNTGPIQVCDNPITESILRITIDGETTSYFGDGLRGSIDSAMINISYQPVVDSLAQEISIFISANGGFPGNYADDNSAFLYDSTVPYNLQGTNPNGGVIFSTFNVLEVDPSIIGNFNGTATNIEPDGSITTVSVSGDFVILQ